MAVDTLTERRSTNHISTDVCPATSAEALAPKPARDPWLDNARWLAATLVVAFHVLEMHMVQGSVSEWLWGVTWVVRLPVFALLAGVFSTDDPQPHARKALISRVLMPMMGVIAMHWALDYWFTGEFVPDPSVPAYTIWFLYGLVLWRLILPYIAMVRWPLLWVTLLALAVGLPNGFQQPWALSATIAHLPFFVLGWQLKKSLPRVRAYRASTIAASIGVLGLIVGLVTLAFVTGHYSTWPQGMGDPYFHSGWSALPEVGIRIGVLVLGAAGALAVLHLTPRRHLPWISLVGSHGFTVYLLHGLVLRVMREYDLLPSVDAVDQSQLPVLLAFSVALALVLGSTPVYRAMGWLIRPRLSWLFVDKADVAAKSRV